MLSPAQYATNVTISSARCQIGIWYDCRVIWLVTVEIKSEKPEISPVGTHYAISFLLFDDHTCLRGTETEYRNAKQHG